VHLVRLIVTATASICILITQAFGSGVELTQVTSTSVTATIQPDSAEVGKTANIWMGALYGSSLFLRNRENWAPYSIGALPIAVSSTTLSASMPLTVVTGLDVSLWPGLKLYLGYGASESDMLATPGKLAQIYPVSRPANVAMTIRVTVPSNTPAADTIWLRQLNASLNEQEVKMTKVSSGPDVWEAAISVPEGTIFRYWFSRNGDWSKWETYPLRAHAGGFHYREVLVRKNAAFNDTVAQWKDLPMLSNATGSIAGLVTSSSGTPLMGIRVSAGPHQTMTRWDGTYRIFGIPAGPTEVTFRADNGEYVPVRASTTVAPTTASTTSVTLAAATMATVTFEVAVPAGTPIGAVPRLLGDTYRLGMFQGFETVAVNSARIVDMAQVSENTWSSAVVLGTGTCANYAYTLGTPSWNNERDVNGSPVVRSLCVIGNMTVKDTVNAWKGPQDVPVTLSVISPTGAADTLYVATDEFGGAAPIKMWPTGTGTASYVFYRSPNSTLSYRYVRNGDGAYGLEIVPPADQNPAIFRTVTSGATGATSNDSVTAWRHQLRETALTTVQTSMTGVIVPRASGSFQTGVQFVDAWTTSWQPLIRRSVARLKSKNVKWAQIASVWGIVNMDPPLVEQGWNSLTTEELVDHIREIKAQGISVALKAFTYAADGAAEAGFKVSHTNAWYDLFFDEVKAAWMYHAKIAQQEGVELLILPGFNWDWVAQTGVSTSPATRAYINSKWKGIIADIRSIAPSVKLTIDMYVPLPEYDWYSDLDYLGDKWWVPLATTDNASVADMHAAAIDRLKTFYEPISARFANKPFLFSEVAYYSANTSAMQYYSVNSPELNAFLPAAATPASDYDEQARAYQATLLAFAATPWVQGCYSFGYWYFDIDSKDAGIRGKTAEEIMSQIYQQLNGM